jgi:hypothetical protein
MCCEPERCELLPSLPQKNLLYTHSEEEMERTLAVSFGPQTSHHVCGFQKWEEEE